MKVSTSFSFFSAAAIVAAVNAKSFSKVEQAILIDRHNFFRSTALPSAAANMCRINWDDDLATKASSTASKCSATTERGINVHQSSSTNSPSIIDEAIQEWVVETAMATIKKMSQPGSTGHHVGVGIYNSYSQVVWASTTSVGCATASCPGGDMVVCVYSPPGNDGKSAWYKHGVQGSECPDGMEAEHGLCITKGDEANNQIASIPEGQWTYQVYPAFVAQMHTLLITSARELANKPISESTGTDATSPSATSEEQALSPKFSSESFPDKSNYSPGEVELKTRTHSTNKLHKVITKSEETALAETEDSELAETEETALAKMKNANEQVSKPSESLVIGSIVGMYVLMVATAIGMMMFVRSKGRQQHDNQLVVDKEHHAVEDKQNVVQTEEHLARNKSKLVPVKDQKLDQNSYDWTKTYEKWDGWEDPEELARQEQDARDRSEHATKAQMGCNHDHSAEQKLMDMTTQAKLTLCNELRVLGNLFFKHGQYQRAAYHYHKALVYFEYVFADTDEEEAQADNLKLKLLLNFAACRLKTMHLDDAVHHANQALEIDQENVKALYRRAQAYRFKDEFHLAQEDIARAIQLSKAENMLLADSVLMQEKKLLQAKMLAYKLRTKLVSSAMFGDKMKVSEGVTDGDVPGFRDPHDSAMTLNLSNTLDLAATSSHDDFQCFSTWKPSTRGLNELQTLIARLDS
ncbi:hypothetical protein KXD40_009703 [Peronospora effusa]|uniref:SCP domain-containing protein n=1 Tax=Peronospora effusa TaxID=542832 RepID=A0A3M6VLS0_9STRA|nr:hypothetical protein DD238_003494 [Peronospora effusa]RQM10841.1 hypothetical protein DD237_004650 [Peronospora effusa]UIZ23891.1 hypothetical protein KXD40_009703 [Peronospora effusa]